MLLLPRVDPAVRAHPGAPAASRAIPAAAAASGWPAAGCEGRLSRVWADLCCGGGGAGEDLSLPQKGIGLAPDLATYELPVALYRPSFAPATPGALAHDPSSLPAHAGHSGAGPSQACTLLRATLGTEPRQAVWCMAPPWTSPVHPADHPAQAARASSTRHRRHPLHACTEPAAQRAIHAASSRQHS